MRVKKTKATPEEFVTIWQQASSMDEVVALCGQTRAEACSRAFMMRQNGVPLKKFGNRGISHNYPALSKLARSLGASK